jgi:hypothetical protein
MALFEVPDSKSRIRSPGSSPADGRGVTRDSDLDLTHLTDPVQACFSYSEKRTGCVPGNICYLLVLYLVPGTLWDTVTRTGTVQVRMYQVLCELIARMTFFCYVVSSDLRTFNQRTRIPLVE